MISHSRQSFSFLTPWVCESKVSPTGDAQHLDFPAVTPYRLAPFTTFRYAFGITLEHACIDSVDPWLDHWDGMATVL
jgi:hypothetical protein